MITNTMDMDIIGDLHVNESLIGDPRVECCASRYLVAGDVLCARGFKSGGRRKILEIRVQDGAWCIRTCDGWYRWTKVYAHVV